MLRKTILILVIIAACCNTGCERDKNITLPPHKQVLVVHGYVETGELFKISVGRTFSANQGVSFDSTYIRNAQVVLYEDNVIVDTLDFDTVSQRYISMNVRAVPGKTYKVIVNSPGFETVEAATSSPFPVNALSVTRQPGTGTNIQGDVLDDILFRFDDPPAENNFYVATLKSGYTFLTSFCVYTRDPAVEKYQAGANPFENSSCISNEEILFTDRSFNGSTKQVVISTSFENLRPITDPVSGKIYKPYLKRYAVTEEFFRHLKSEITLDILANDPFATPVVIKGNVRNGYGIFTVLGASVDTLQ